MKHRRITLKAIDGAETAPILSAGRHDFS